MKYFITSYGGGHVAMCIPVIRELQARGHEVSVMALTTAGEALKREGIPHTRPIDYVDYKTVEPYGRRLLAKHHTDGKGITAEESIAYLGVSLHELVQEVGEEKAWELYEQKGLMAFGPVQFLKHVLAREKPDRVISTNSPRMEMAALRAAHTLGIPSLCMIDTFGIMEVEWIADPRNGDIITVFSEKVKQLYVKHGRKPEHIFVTGNPAFDKLAAYAERDVAADYKAKKNIARDKKIILWAEQGEPVNPALPGQVREHLQRVCAAHPDWQLVVRLHPSLPPVPLPESVVQSFSHEPVQEAVASADVVVTLTSTVGVEALLLDTPLLIIAISYYQWLADFSEGEGALLVHSLEETEAGLQTLLSDNPTAQRLRTARHALPKAGGATQRICDLLGA